MTQTSLLNIVLACYKVSPFPAPGSAAAVKEASSNIFRPVPPFSALSAGTWQCFISVARTAASHWATSLLSTHP